LGRWGEMSPSMLRRSVKLGTPPRSKRESLVLIAVPYLGAQAKAWLTKANINYVDLAGNIRIVGPGIYVEREGADRPERMTPDQRVNPFSRRASLVPRALLTQAEPKRVLALADRLGLAQGWVSLVVAEMERRAYVVRDREGVRLVNAAGLLRDWTNVYDWRRNVRASFLVPYDHHELEMRLPAVLSSETWALTLLSGADYTAPVVEQPLPQWHVYVEPGSEQSVRDRLESDLHAKLLLPAAADNANVHILTPYYGRAAFFGSEVSRGMRIVSPLQLYLDLIHYPARGREAADAILRLAVAPRAGLSPAEVRALVQL